MVSSQADVCAYLILHFQKATDKCTADRDTVGLDVRSRLVVTQQISWQTVLKQCVANDEVVEVAKSRSP